MLDVTKVVQLLWFMLGIIYNSNPITFHYILRLLLVVCVDKVLQLPTIWPCERSSLEGTAGDKKWIVL
jgi:hypothetical protein